MRALGSWQEALLSKPKSSFTKIYWKDRCLNCKKTGYNKYKCSQPIDEAECSKNQIALREENKKPNDGRRRNRLPPYEWHPPSPAVFGKRVILGKPYNLKTNGFWNIVSTPDSGLTPGDAAAAASIATAAAAITTANQKTTGAALIAAAKAIKFPTAIGENNDNGTAVTKITQDQLNEINRLQANIGN